MFKNTSRLLFSFIMNAKQLEFLAVMIGYSCGPLYTAVCRADVRCSGKQPRSASSLY